MNDGLIVRTIAGRRVGILRCGAGTPAEARAMADAYLARRGIAATWTSTRAGYRLKVGISGLRRFDVYYQLEGGVPR